MKHIIIFLSFVFFISGCGSNEDLIHNVVLSYVNIVDKAYSMGEFDEAASVLGQKQIRLLTEQVQNFDELQFKLDPILRSIRIVQVDLVSDSVAIEVTKESWDFRYTSSMTGKELWNMSLDFTMVYSLENVSGKWFVMEVDRQAAEGNAEKNFDPFVELPAEIVFTGVGQTTEELLKNTVVAYLKLLADGYKNQDMSPLVHFATKRRAMKAYYHMSSMGEGQVRMEPQLLAIEISEPKLLPGEVGQVITKEHWNYMYYSTQSGIKTYENLANYTLTYKLVKDNGNRWLVDDITMEHVETGEGEGDLPFFTRPHDKATQADG